MQIKNGNNNRKRGELKTAYYNYINHNNKANERRR